MAGATNELSKKLVKEGQRIFKEVMPKKCLELTELIASDLFATPDLSEVEAELAKITQHHHAPASAASTHGNHTGSSTAAGGGRRKRRKMDTKGNHHATTDGAASSDSEGSDASDHEAEPKVFPPVPCNKAITKVIAVLKKELYECIDIVGAVKLWIQLCVPPIESGGQFSVGVQEECLGVLGRFEEQGYNLMDGLTKYHQGRARMVAKLQRHPSVMDYKQTILELDQLEFVNLRNAMIELRNAYLCTWDILTKNSENLAPPRSMASGMVV